MIFENYKCEICNQQLECAWAESECVNANLMADVRPCKNCKHKEVEDGE